MKKLFSTLLNEIVYRYCYVDLKFVPDETRIKILDNSYYDFKILTLTCHKLTVF